MSELHGDEHEQLAQANNKREFYDEEVDLALDAAVWDETFYECYKSIRRLHEEMACQVLDSEEALFFGAVSSALRAYDRLNGDTLIRYNRERV